MISFYPGPSKVEEKIPQYVKQAHKEGILGMNHRSDEFVSMSSNTIELLKKKLFIPEDYTIFFVSSATECWEIIAQSLMHDTSYHFYNGAFGEKWFEYSKKIHPLSIGYKFDQEAQLKLTDIDLSSDEGIICLTQNETSNGTRISNKRIASIRKSYPNHLIAVDATSSMAGDHLKFENADVWYASVQKCFGLPAGMALMICSPKAIDKAMTINERTHYNSLPIMIDKMKVYQTTHTPNVLNIYLLQQVLKQRKPIDKIHKKLKQRSNQYEKLIANIEGLEVLITNEKVKSHTVTAIKGDPKLVKQIKKDAKASGLLLGNGYGDLADKSFRIANFPAHKNKDIKLLTHFFESRS